MGLFDKFFGKKEESNKDITSQPEALLDISALKKVSKSMDADKFWMIVEDSLKHNLSLGFQEKSLINAIAKLSPEEMIGFRLYTDELLFKSYNSEMWCAAYIINGGCSDDGFEYFRNWVISRGRKVYENALQNPDSLIGEIGENNQYYDFESFWYVALEAFSRRTGQDLYDYIDYDKVRMKESNYPHFEFNWSDSDPESMKKICPQLYEKLWQDQ